MKKIALSLFLFASVTSLNGQSLKNPQLPPSFSLLEISRASIIDQLFLKDSVSVFQVNRPSIKQPSMAHTAFFCKLESRLEQSSKLPLRMRLGDLSYTNMIEGKNVHDLNAVNPRLNK